MSATVMHNSIMARWVPLKKALRGSQLRPHFLSGIGGSSTSVNDQDGSIPSLDVDYPTSAATMTPIIRSLDTLATRAGFTWRNSFGVSSIVTAKNNNNSSNNRVNEGPEEIETTTTTSETNSLSVLSSDH